MSINRIPFEDSVGLDFVMAQLRSQILTLHKLLETIERTHRYQDEYVWETLKAIEAEIRKLRQLCEV